MRVIVSSLRLCVPAGFFWRCYLLGTIRLFQTLAVIDMVLPPSLYDRGVDLRCINVEIWELNIKVRPLLRFRQNVSREGARTQKGKHTLERIIFPTRINSRQIR